MQFAILRVSADRLQPAPVQRLSVFNALACTVLPFFATMMAIARVGAAKVALTAMVGPVPTVVLGYAFLGAAVSTWQVAGTILVLGRVWVLSRKSS